MNMAGLRNPLVLHELWASESQTPGLKFLYPLTGYVLSGPYVNLSVPPFPHL